eukprot:TRINITY_DN17814_c0_g1_i1.p1 TRINITY_DN17814_c0_g1~~TRINITY_DN17814_c0_g1_i1.p1  ORF type:complete len:221 (+),score=44.58 TRINITY_DN17814_c0_g1_i1:186-848(+)
MCAAGYQGDGITCHMLANVNEYPEERTYAYEERTTMRNIWAEEEDNGYPAYVPPSQQQRTTPRPTRPTVMPTRRTTQSWLRPFIATKSPDANDENAPTCLFGVCTCSNNLIFDGTNCVEQSLPRGQCRTKDDCDPKANCEYDDYEQAYKCKCMKSYEGDGLMCQPGPDAGCDILENCHTDAKCLVNEAAGQHYCRCNTGFEWGMGTNVENGTPDWMQCNQ